MGLAVGIVIAFVGAALWMRAPQADDVVTAVAVNPDIPALPNGNPVALPNDTDDVAPFVGLPLRGPVVAHVWLENCADCMSAFEAYRQLRNVDGLHGLPQVNVSYGASTAAFAERYRVNENLVADIDGSQVVRPFGIGSFTTLVLDKNGDVILRDRPDHAGYAERVKEAWTSAVR